ncbi:MAG: hypothetical protein CO093_07300 [Alphaproteobacteria bacterium CG_4_9_14_3_um_filter_47_13]|nr:MAG: hypothetical protein CO093_07300 [Alphaproteobacteria bacterium CG_4_9_14_3_um_filter_47_13]
MNTENASINYRKVFTLLYVAAGAIGAAVWAWLFWDTAFIDVLIAQPHVQPTPAEMELVALLKSRIIVSAVACVAGGVAALAFGQWLIRSIAYAKYLWPHRDHLEVVLRRDDRTFIETLCLLTFGLPIVVLVKTVWLTIMIMRYAFLPIAATIIVSFIHAEAGFVLGVVTAVFLSVKVMDYYKRINAPPALEHPKDALQREYEALDAEAKRLFGDAHFLSPVEVFSKQMLGLVRHGVSHAPFMGKMPTASLAEYIDFGDEKPPQGLVRYPGKAHLLTFAATGTGKGRGTIIPNLLDYDGSVLVIDPKGENAAVTARHRSTMHQVAVLDPWGKSGIETASFNPLSWITEENEHYIADAASLAEAIVVPGRSGDTHWEDSARDLIKGLILYVALEAKPDQRHLLYLREVLSYMPGTLKALFAKMGESDKADGVIRRSGNRFRDMPEKEFGSILSTAQRHTQFLDDAPEPMRKVLVETTFDIRDLKRDSKLSLYLCLPPSRLKSHNRWLRIMVNMAISVLEAEQKTPDKPVLFILDEAAVLGHMQKLAESVGLMRGYGMQLWTIWQDLNQLKAAYKDEWQSFISNAGAIQVFGINDNDTAEYFSKHGGEYGFVKRGASAGAGQNIQGAGGGVNANEGGNLTIDKRRLILPQDMKNMPPDMVYCFMQGEYPIECSKTFYDQEPRFAGLFDDNPFL